MHVCPLQYSSRTLPATQSKPGLLADKLSEVQMSYLYLCLCVCQYLWIIKFLEWTYRKKGGIWGGIFIDWNIEGSFFVWFYYVFRLYSTWICLFANQAGWSWVSDSGHYLTTGFSRLDTFNPHAPPPFVNMTELLTTVIQVGGLTHHFLGKCLHKVGNMIVVF